MSPLASGDLVRVETTGGELVVEAPVERSWTLDLLQGKVTVYGLQGVWQGYRHDILARLVDRGCARVVRMGGMA